MSWTLQHFLDQFNAYRTDFSVSKNSPHKTVLLCLLMSLRCTCSFSRPSTADVLSLRPYAHTRANLSSRSPSIAPMFTHTFSRKHYQMDCKPQPHNLTASGSRTIVSKCSVFKVHPRFIQLGDNCPQLLIAWQLALSVVTGIAMPGLSDFLYPLLSWL